MSAATSKTNTTSANPTEWRAKLQQYGLLPRLSQFPANDALLPLLEALQWRGDMRELADLLQIQSSELRWGDLANVLRALGFVWGERRGTLKHLQPTDLPCLFLTKKGEQAYLITEMSADDFIGRILPGGSMERIPHSTERGTIVTLQPVDTSEPPPKLGQWFKVMIRSFRGQFRDALLLGTLINLFALSVPVFTMLVYDRVIAGHSIPTLYYLLGGVIIALEAESLLRRLRANSLCWFGVRANHIIAVTMFQRLFSLDPLTIERAPPAAQMVRAKAMESVRDFLTGQSFILFIEFPFIPVLLVALALLSPLMAGVCFSTGIILAVFLSTQLRVIRHLSQRSARAMSERQRDALELFAKLQTLRTQGLSDAVYNRYALSNSKASAASLDVTWRMQVVEHLVLAISMLGGLSALLMGVEGVWGSHLTPGGLIASMIIVWRILMPMQQLAAIAPRLEQVNGGIQQLEHLVALVPERPESRESSATYSTRGEVELINLTMRYPRQSDVVFSGLSIHLKPGEMVAIAGANGSGKSSILKLINGMYKQAAGSIRLDGIDIRQLDPLGLRRSVTYISQSPIMFNGTVMENLTLASPLATQEQVAEALERAGALDDVLQLPQAFDTMLGEHGIQLAQELAYKLNLARAYIDLKPLILCDELPYALLTTEAGKQFRRMLTELKGKHTIMVVAHTSDIVKIADRAVFLRANYRPMIGTPKEIIPQIVEQMYEYAG